MKQCYKFLSVTDYRVLNQVERQKNNKNKYRQMTKVKEREI